MLSTGTLRLKPRRPSGASPSDFLSPLCRLSRHCAHAPLSSHVAQVPGEALSRTSLQAPLGATVPSRGRRWWLKTDAGLLDSPGCLWTVWAQGMGTGCHRSGARANSWGWVGAVLRRRGGLRVEDPQPGGLAPSICLLLWTPTGLGIPVDLSFVSGGVLLRCPPWVLLVPPRLGKTARGPWEPSSPWLATRPCCFSLEAWVPPGPRTCGSRVSIEG